MSMEHAAYAGRRSPRTPGVFISALPPSSTPQAVADALRAACRVGAVAVKILRSASGDASAPSAALVDLEDEEEAQQVLQRCATRALKVQGCIVHVAPKLPPRPAAPLFSRSRSNSSSASLPLHAGPWDVTHHRHSRSTDQRSSHGGSSTHEDDAWDRAAALGGSDTSPWPAAPAEHPAPPAPAGSAADSTGSGGGGGALLSTLPMPAAPVPPALLAQAPAQPASNDQLVALLRSLDAAAAQRAQPPPARPAAVPPPFEAPLAPAPAVPAAAQAALELPSPLPGAGFAVPGERAGTSAPALGSAAFGAEFELPGQAVHDSPPGAAQLEAQPGLSAEPHALKTHFYSHSGSRGVPPVGSWPSAGWAPPPAASVPQPVFSSQLSPCPPQPPHAPLASSAALPPAAWVAGVPLPATPPPPPAPHLGGGGSGAATPPGSLASLTPAGSLDRSLELPAWAPTSVAPPAAGWPTPALPYPAAAPPPSPAVAAAGMAHSTSAASDACPPVGARSRPRQPALLPQLMASGQHRLAPDGNALAEAAAAAAAAAAATAAQAHAARAAVCTELNELRAKHERASNCLICSVSRRSVVVLPCRHLSLCGDCAAACLLDDPAAGSGGGEEAAMRSGACCPLCLAPVDGFIAGVMLPA